MHDLAKAPVPLPGGLELEWLGTAGYRLTYDGQTLLIEPYLTRVPFSQVLGRTPVRADLALHDQCLPRAKTGNVAGILVGHTHFDHAIDVPELARAHSAQTLGSASLVQLMRAYGLERLAVEVEPHRTYELGPFKVQFAPSLHSKLLLGYKVPLDGALSCDHLDGLCPSAYRCGQVYGIRIEVAGTVLYHQGSANLIDDQVPSGGVDVFLAGIAGRSFTPDYWDRILSRLDPAVVVANHYDDFFRPLTDPVGFSTNVNLSALPEEIHAVSREIGVAALPPLGVRRG